MKNKYIYSFFLASLFALQVQAQCLEDTHTPFEADSWISCETADNPNADRPAGHWIMYDLGFAYKLDSTYLWNYNVWGKADAGMQVAVIDYSLDGTEWTTLDTFVIDKASASYKYEGQPGPDFGGEYARFILLTALDNWGDPQCTGFSEMKFYTDGAVNNDPSPEPVEGELVVTPNPVIDIADVSIRADYIPETVGLYDLSGRLISEQNTGFSGNLSFNMKGLPAGIYFVKAQMEEGVLTEKIVKVGR